MTVTKAKRALSNYAKTGRNWRLMGLYASHPEVPSGITERDMAKAWPLHSSEHRRLSTDSNDHASFNSEKTYLVEEEDESRELGVDGVDAYRQLSDATNESDWSEGPFGQKAIPADRAIKRSLAFQDSVENLDVLFRKEIFDTVIEGARKAEVARDATTVFPVDRDKGDHPRGQDTTFAPNVAEGAAIPDQSEQHDTVEWDTERFGQGAAATDKLIRQSNVAVIERNIEFIGHSVEMKNNRLWLNNLLDNVDTGNDVVTTSPSNKSLASVNQAIANIETDDFEPDTVAMHPQYTQVFFDEGNSTIPIAVNEAGDNSALRDRMAFPLLGVEGVRVSGGVANGSTTWNFTAADEFGAVVYDSDRLGMYLFQDIEMKEYEDPIRDLQGVNARMEVDHVWHHTDAGARLEHS